MTLLPRVARAAVLAVLDVALHARGRPVSSKELAARHALPPRRLESLLQALVRAGVLNLCVDRRAAMSSPRKGGA